MDFMQVMVYSAVAVVLIFDYTNGFHDASNIIATPIASRALTPIQAVVIVATFEFLGPLLGGTAVANTIGKFVNLDAVAAVLSIAVILCGYSCGQLGADGYRGFGATQGRTLGEGERNCQHLDYHHPRCRCGIRADLPVSQRLAWTQLIRTRARVIPIRLCFFLIINETQPYWGRDAAGESTLT